MINLNGLNGGYPPTQIPKSKGIKQGVNFKDVLSKSTNTDTVTVSQANSSQRSDSVSSDNYLNDIDRKLAELREADKNADYTGMSKEEIHGEIEKRYLDAFGDTFWSATTFVGLTQDFMNINDQFLSEIHKHKVKVSFELQNKARDYEGMSYDEIEKTIISKYEGKNAMIDQLNMLGELYHAGVFSNKMGPSEAGSFMGKISDAISREYGFQNIQGNEYILSSEQIMMTLNQKADCGFIFNEILRKDPFIPQSYFDIYDPIIDELLKKLDEIKE